MKTTIQLRAQLMQVPASEDHRWAKQLASDVMGRNWRQTTHLECLPQSPALEIIVVSTSKWLYGLMRGTSECVSNLFFFCLQRSVVKTRIDFLQFLLQHYSVVAVLSWGLPPANIWPCTTKTPIYPDFPYSSFDSCFGLYWFHTTCYLVFSSLPCFG